MSLELAWKNDTLEFPSTISNLWGSGYGGCYAVPESGVGYESAVHCFAIGTGSAGSVPGVKWKMKGSTGELLEGPTVVPWYEAGFIRYSYDPSDGGTLYKYYRGSSYAMYRCDPDTMATLGEKVFDGYPDPGYYNSDGTVEYWNVDAYGRIADRELILGHDSDDYQDEMSIFNDLTDREVGRVIIPVSYNNMRHFIGITKDMGYIVGNNGVVAPVYLTEGFDQTQARNHAGRSLRADPNLFTNWQRTENNFVDPVTKNILRFDISADQSSVTMWCFKQNPAPGFITPPVPTAIPREGRRVELVSQVYSETGRLCSNWAYDFDETGNGDVTSPNPAKVTDSYGNVRLSLDCGDTGGYSQTVDIDIEVPD